MISKCDARVASFLALRTMEPVRGLDWSVKPTTKRVIILCAHHRER